MRRSIASSLFALAAATAASAQSLKEIDAREQALVQAWEATPLGARRAMFVTEKAPIYGAYTARPDAVFKPDEPLVAYIEPVGYLWKPAGDAFRFGVTLDFVVKKRDGAILGGQEKFLAYDQTSRAKLRELMLNVTLTLSGITPGDYIVEYTMRDASSAKTVKIELPFTIKA